MCQDVVIFPPETHQKGQTHTKCTLRRPLEAIENFFGNADSCQRLMRALCVATCEAQLKSNRYRNMDLLIEHKKDTPGKVRLIAAGGRDHPPNTMKTFLHNLKPHNSARPTGKMCLEKARAPKTRDALS